jgi:hypothetical protein
MAEKEFAMGDKSPKDKDKKKKQDKRDQSNAAAAAKKRIASGLGLCMSC